MQTNLPRTLFILGCGLCMALIAYVGQAGNGPGRFSLMSEKSGGLSIRRQLVDPWRLDYRLITLAKGEDVATQEKAEECDPELVLYLDGPEFLAAENIQVIFRILGPGGNEIRARGLSLLGGYGANLYLESAGTYQIAVRIESPLGVFSDSFAYRRR